MLRDPDGNPVDGGKWFIHHGTDVETNWAATDPLSYQTPTERFFVRNHTTAPEIDPASWRLEVWGDGLAGDATAYSLDEIQKLGSTTYDRALECTGNGRRLFDEQQGEFRPGTQWGLGAIGLATWTGVPLRTVLEDAGLRADAVQVMPVGLDASYVCNGTDYGHVRRPLPIEKALDDVLVAWEMNGAPLAPDHGFPVRLVVPGWVGIASIKWLGSLEVTTTRCESPWSTKWYRMHGAGYDDAPDPQVAVLDRMPVKSMVDLHADPAFIAGRLTVLRGRAWSGDATIAAVEVSTDDGGTWAAAALIGPNERSCWVEWEHPWTPSAAGDQVIRTRATDSSGRTQPDTVSTNDDGYLFWAVVRQPVTVTAPDPEPSVPVS